MANASTGTVSGTANGVWRFCTPPGRCLMETVRCCPVRWRRRCICMLGPAVPYQSANMRPGLKIPAGSNCFLRSRWMRSSGALSGENTGTVLLAERNSVAWPQAASAASRMAWTSPAGCPRPFHPALCAAPLQQRGAQGQWRGRVGHADAPQGFAILQFEERQRLFTQGRPQLERWLVHQVAAHGFARQQPPPWRRAGGPTIGRRASRRR